jgi:cell division protein FtsL
VAFVAIALFGVVIAHVLLMQGQFELEAMQHQAAKQQAEYDRLRLQVAELESPERIVAAAQERLGMVSPPKITYLAPSADTMPAPRDSDAAQAPTGPRVRGTAAPPSSWSTVKPHLSEG